MEKLKVGLDFHGVIEKYPALFRALSEALIKQGCEVHILTGPRRDSMEPELQRLGIKYTHFFSIVEYNEDCGTPIEWIDGDPWMDELSWDKAKGEYCRDNGIGLHIDDSNVYGQHFVTPYLRLEV